MVEDSIKKIEEYFQANVVGIVESDEKQNIARVSRGISKLLGYQPEDLIGKSWAELTHPDDAHVGAEELRRLKRGDRASAQFEKRYITKSGEVVPTLVNIQAGDWDTDGRPQWYVAFVVSLAELATARHTLAEALAARDGSERKAAEALAAAVEKREPVMVGHQSGVATLAVQIGARLGYDTARLEGLYLAGATHDIGKIAVPVECLTTPSLTGRNIAVIRNHPSVGYQILRDIGTPWPLAQTAYQHHERFDGSGYPFGLSGHDILPEARIIAVADTVDAMQRPSPSRAAFPADVIKTALKFERGTRLDAETVDSCLEILKSSGSH